MTLLLDGSLRLAGGLDERFFALLAALDEAGSLTRAARAAGYSYKGAWLLLERAETLAQAPLLARSAGGAGGGGTQLTPAGRRLLEAWQQLQQAHQHFLRTQAQQLAGTPLAQLFRRMSMQTTARNQFAGRIAQIVKGPASGLVSLQLDDGRLLAASLSSAALQALKLKKGQEAQALVKASDVLLVSDFGGLRLSADNQFEGTVARVQKGGSGALVVLQLPGGGARISASVTLEAVETLGLRVGQPTTAVFKAADVMLATD
jgi:molybdate transport system regulatory protein